MAEQKKKPQLYDSAAELAGASTAAAISDTLAGSRARWAEAAGKPTPVMQPGGLGGAIGGFMRGLSGAPAPPPVAAPLATASRPAVATAAPVARMSLNGPSAAAEGPVLSTLAPTVVRPALQPGDANTFTGSNGVTRSVPFAALATAPTVATQPAVRGPAPVVTQPNNAALVQGATDRAIGGTRTAALTARQDATEMLNPMSGGGELMRRFEISQGGFKGSPSARRMAGEAILGQLGAQNAASAAGQAGANQVLQQGAEGEGVAGENYAARRLDADQFNVESSLRQSESLERMQRPMGDPIRDVNGRTSILRGDGSTTLLRDDEGNAIRTPGAQDQADVLSLKDLLSSYNAQATAISGDTTATPAEKIAQMNALKQDPLYASRLFNQGGAAPPAGTVKDGYRFKGGDPANRASWEKVN